MRFNYKINSLAFKAVLKEQANIKSLVEDIKVDNNSGLNCKLSFYFSYDLPVYPTGLILFLEIIRNIKIELPEIFLQFNVDQYSYLNKIGFGAFIRGESTIESNYNAGKTNIPLTKITKKEIDELCITEGISIGEATEILVTPFAKLISNSNVNLIEPFTYIIREIARNSFEHGNSEMVFLCIQHWPKRDEIEIAIADNGIGIMDSLRSNMNYRNILNSNEQSLLFSLEPGISKAYSRRRKKNESYWDNSGYGLYVAHQLCHKLDGYFTLGSYNSRLSYSQNDIETYDFDYNGTLVGMIFKYSKLERYDEIMKIIRKEGQYRAKKNKLGFYKPSGASVNRDK